MFYLNLGFKWHAEGMKLPGTGAVILASGNAAHRLHRSRIPADLGALLLDPQLYLSGLDGNRCAPTCARLATHRWFGLDGVPAVEPGESGSRAKLQEIEKNIGKIWTGKLSEDEDEMYTAAALAFVTQQELGCSVFIAPAPLIDPGGAGLEAFGAWLDRSIGAWQDLDVGQPLLATIAINEGALDEAAFSDTGLLERIVDQVSSREELEGAYVVVAQAAARHPFETGERVLAAFLRLSRRLRESGVGTVVTNFCDLGGLGCIALGATGTATGPSQSLRRLALSGFEDREGGGALPTLYCHASASEYLTEDDIGGWYEKRFFQRILDRTKFSENLYEAVVKGKPIGSLPDWVQSKNNVTASQNHYVQRVASEVAKLSSIPATERTERVEDWLEMADQKQLYIRERLKVRVRGSEAPVGTWAKVLDSNRS